MKLFTTSILPFLILTKESTTDIGKPVRTPGTLLKINPPVCAGRKEVIDKRVENPLISI